MDCTSSVCTGRGPVVYKTLGLCRSCYDRRSLGDENKPRVYTRGFTIVEKMAHYRTDDGPGECFGWSGRVSQHGYAQLWTGGKNGSFRAAHRVAYELEHGEIPEGLQIDHTCHNEDMSCPGGVACLHRRCTNPAHLAAKTRLDNVGDARRSERPGYLDRHHNAAKTHDKWGHEFSPENTVISGGHRYCLECRRLRARGEHPTQIAKREG
jgi:hypothetical protein